MSANVESMFSVRETPWHGLGSIIQDAPNSADAIRLAGLDWLVKQTDLIPANKTKKIIEEIKFKMLMGESVVSEVLQLDELVVPGYKVNYRDSDGKVLGVVTDRYKIIQNADAFSFTDSLLGDGVRYETAGSLASGKRIWLLARMPKRNITDEDVDPYLVFTNSHDGKGAVNVCITPVRVVCQNTLNMALASAKRKWSCVHTGDIQGKLEEARMTLANANAYMDSLEEEFGELKMIKMDKDKVWEYIKILVPIDETTEEKTKRITDRLWDVRNGIFRCWEASDLQDREESAFRFINAVSDYATHSEPGRKTKNFYENRFIKTVDGNPMIDKAYELVGALR